MTLAPGESTTIAVTFAPNAAGTHTAALEITHSGLNGPSVVPLSGTAEAIAALYRVNVGDPGVAGTPEWSADTAAAPSPYTNAADTDNQTARHDGDRQRDPQVDSGGHAVEHLPEQPLGSGSQPGDAVELSRHPGHL